MSDIRQQITSYANSIGLPSWIPLSIVGVEDPSLDPRAVNPQSGATGIFQILPGHFPGAENLTSAQLQNPALNIQLGETEMKREYVQGAAQKAVTGHPATPQEIVEYVASHGGWPDRTGNLPTDYRTALDASLRSVQGAPPATQPWSPQDPGAVGVAENPGSLVTGWVTDLEHAATDLLKWITPHALLIGGAALALILFLLHLGRDVPAVPA